MYKLFKGYIHIKNKRAAESFKGKSSKELMSLRQAKGLDEYAAVLNDNTVMIDIDSKRSSKILLRIIKDKGIKCKVLHTTKGMHFYFQNNGVIEKQFTGKYTAIGLKSDCKPGSKAAYAVHKLDGVQREVAYDILNDEEYDEVPKWLTKVDGDFGFLKMDEGDGRNQALFNYILTLQSNGFSKAEARETISIINDYVLKEPLSQKELSVILRDEAFEKPIFFDKKQFLHHKFGNYLINEYNIKKVGNVLYYYDDGFYQNGNIERLMIKNIPSLKKQQRQEVIYYLKAYINETLISSDAQYIAFRNGLYNLDTEKLEEFTPDKMVTNKINWDYNPDAYSKLADDVLNRLCCGDEKIRMLVDEVIGYCFYRRNELRKAFMLKGKRHNGKSTFLDMLGYLLGNANISSIDLSDLSHEFKAAGLIGKLANLGDDIEDEYIPSAGIFKKIVSGDRMNTNKKYEDPIEFNPYCKLIFSGNTIPRLGRGRDSEAIIDRLIIIPFKADFTKDNDDFDPHIKYKLHDPEVMEYLIKIGIEGLQRVLSNNGFTECEEVQKELDDFTEKINPITTFFEEVGDDLENEPTKFAYRKYKEFCMENVMKPMAHVEFSKIVKEQKGYVIKAMKINGKTTKVFIKER